MKFALSALSALTLGGSTLLVSTSFAATKPVTPSHLVQVNQGFDSKACAEQISQLRDNGYILEVFEIIEGADVVVADLQNESAESAVVALPCVEAVYPNSVMSTFRR